ncbi:ribbon-helix-helix protein, CopG family [Arvimicrobium flavum]|uniref:ribbon-helix-helix protein, CopG family n=1 Tax=Arvimicrobium flavum TaxID=3393320 RepID=UPI00237A22AD|nr:ribbon-helix-helix protein, CopG family [Mesorhizobium shangrilense]
MIYVDDIRYRGTMMRTLVDIEEAHLRELDRLAKKKKKSRASIIRQAVAEYLEKRTPASLDEAFGLWGDRKVDGLEYQEKIRSEW